MRTITVPNKSRLILFFSSDGGMAKPRRHVNVARSPCVCRWFLQWFLWLWLWLYVLLYYLRWKAAFGVTSRIPQMLHGATESGPGSPSCQCWPLISILYIYYAITKIGSIYVKPT